MRELRHAAHAAAALGRVLLFADLELGIAGAPFFLGELVHYAGDVVTAAGPGRLVCVRSQYT